MTTGIAAFSRWFRGGQEYKRIQNFFVGKTIDGYAYQSFQSSQIQISRTGDSGGVALEFPATSEILDLGNKALDESHLVEVVLYEMPVDSGIPTGIESAAVIAQFLGEVQTMATDLVRVTIEIGAALDAISGDIPGRKITTSLVGRLPTL